MTEVLRVLLFVIFGISSLLLIVVILLQEGKGGGLAAAFGGAGADTFGVGAGGINRFTSVLAACFILTAIMLAATAPGSAAEGISTDQGTDPVENAGENPPDDPGATDPVDDDTGGDDDDDGEDPK